MTRRNPPPEYLYRRWRPIFVTAMVGPFLAFLDITIVNLSIPSLQAEFGADVGTVSWIVNAYTIAFAVPLVTMGRLADQFGRRRFMLLGLVTFLTGSIVCTFAPTVETLVAGRVVQGLGASALVPIGLAMTMTVFPPERRGRAIALQALLSTSGAAVGPPLGGLIIELSSWEWIFAVNVPFCVVALWAAIRVVPETYDLDAHERIDLIGMVLVCGSVLALTLALVEGNGRGWGSPEIVALFGAAVALAAGFVASQRWGRYPTITPALAANRQFLMSCAGLLIFSIGSIGMLFLVVLGMVELWGYSVLGAALATLPLPIGAMLAVPVLTRLSDRTTPRAVAVPGILIAASGIYVLTMFPAEPALAEALLASFLVGTGVGLANPSFTRGAMGTLAGGEFGLGSGLILIARQIGIAIGIALVAAALTAGLEDNVEEVRPQITEAAAARDVGRAEIDATLSGLASAETVGATPSPTVLGAEAAALARGAARDAFREAFVVALLGALAAVPLTLTLKRRAPVEPAPLASSTPAEVL